MLLTPSTIGAIQQDPLRRIFKQASLDLQFAERKSLVDATTGSNLVDFTRASSGTYVGSDGLIKTAVTNLLLRSEEFDNGTSWTTNGLSSFGSGSTANAGTAPNGTNTADLLTETALNEAHNIIQSATGIIGSTYTVSVYAKPNNRQWLIIYTLGGIAASTAAWFDLQNGVVGSRGANNVNATIQSVGNGWYRCTSTWVATGSSGQLYFQLASSNGGTTYTGDGTSGIYLWGAQLEQSSTVGEYVKTTSTINSAPRFDHDPTTGESLGLLVEESRTNLQADSEDLSGYNKRDVTTPLDSSVINPTGSTGSYKILANSGLATGGIRIYKSANSVNNIVVSAFVKKSTHRYTFIGFGGNVNSFTALFDIEPGLTSNRLLGQSGTGTYTNIDAGYQNFPNDWIRIWAVGTTAGNNGLTLGMGPDATTFDITNWTAAGTEEIYAWGLQYEDDVSFPTSYIPTEGSTVTRAADVASISGSNFSGWYNQSIGTLFCDVFLSRDIEQSSGNTGSWTLDNGSFARGIGMSHIAGTQARLFIRDSAYQATCNVVGISKSRIKTCALIKLNSNGLTQTNTMCANGVLGNNLAPYDISDEVTIDRLLIGNQNISGNPANNTLNGSIKRLTYWPQEVASNTRINITT